MSESESTPASEDTTDSASSSDSASSKGDGAPGGTTPVTRAVVIHESLTGNTAAAAQMIADELTRFGIETSASPITAVDLEALSHAQLVVVGSWVDGLFFFGQKPGREGRLKKLPVIDGKLAAVFCTYAVDKGKTLTKLDRIVSMRGGDVIGGYGIKRSDLQGGAEEFVGRLLSAVDARSALPSSNEEPEHSNA